MDLTGALRRFAAARPHVLIVEVPGGTGARLAVEREVRVRGWSEAAAPADADLLVVAGAAGPELAPYLDRVWVQLTRPRVRLDLIERVEVPAALMRGRELLARGGDPRPSILETGMAAGGDADEDDGGHHRDPGYDEKHRDHEQHGGHAPQRGLEQHRRNEQHGGHAGHGAGTAPGGLVVADRAADRDGLRLDQLHVPLGPALRHWPPGLVLHTSLQGDVVQDATVQVLDGGPTAENFWAQITDPARPTAAAVDGRTAARLDALARLLAVAGWEPAEIAARRLRDDLLAGAGAGELAPAVSRFARRLRRSRTLQWLTADVPSLDGLDVLAHWRSWLLEIEHVIGIAASNSVTGPPPAFPLESRDRFARLPGLVAGQELAAVRLIVASLEPAPTVPPVPAADG